jgi:plastocyanin
MWFATVGAQSSDKGRQALAFLPNEIWIHAGDSITWQFDADEVHTVTFVPDSDTRPAFFDAPPSAPSFDGSKAVSSPGVPAPFVKGDKFTLEFTKTGNFKQVCLFHQNMTGVVHVLPANAPLLHNQDFYDREAADQRRDLLSDRDGRSVAACGQCAAHDSLKARVVTAGTGEISATAGGSQTLSVVRFLEDKVEIRAGDTVEWTNQDPVTPHTVTFGMEPTDLADPSAILPATITLDADGALHANISSNADSVHSGFIKAGAQDPFIPNELNERQTPLGVTRFRVTFMRPGAFPYICALHDNLGMKGMVIVLPTPPPQ